MAQSCPYERAPKAQCDRKKTVMTVLMKLDIVCYDFTELLKLIFALQKSLVGYTILVMAVFWCTEVIPLAITSLIPLVVLPLTGVVTTNQVAINFMKVSIHFRCCYTD